MKRIENIEIVRAIMCGLSFFIITRLVELLANSDKEKQKKLVTELAIAFTFLVVIRTLY